jgi:hypothetical protein
MQLDREKTMDIGALPLGVYLIKAVFENGSYRTMRFIKN